MAVFDHIVVGVDGSENSMAALEKGAELADLTGAEFSILTVYRHHSMLEASLSMVRADDPGNMDDILREHARGIAETAKIRAQELGIDGARAFVKNGPVARSIIEFAHEHRADLIVIGGRGLGTVETYLLGSVSHKVTGLSERPVLVV